MGRIVLVEEVVKEYVDRFTKEKLNKVGLVLGQSRHSEQKDHVIHLAETPLLVDDEGENESKATKSNVIEDWKADLVTQHAIQVTRMLVAGFDVLGIFLCTPTETISSANLAHIRQLLSSIHKVLNEEHYYVNCEGTERLFVHISCVPNKITCKTLNVTSSLASPKPAELKFLTVPTKWTQLNCQLAIDFLIPQNKENSQNSLVHQFKLALKPICDQIKRALATIDGCIKCDDELLDPVPVSTSKGKRGGKHRIETEENYTKTSVDVDLYIDTESTTESDVSRQECEVAMKFSGTIIGRTYVPGKCTVQEGVQFLKLDLLRSLVSRCDIHCDDLLVIEEEQQDRVVVHELPRRIFAPLAGLDLTVSDYLFPGETANNSLEAFKELLDLTPSVDDIEDKCERFPDSGDLAYPLLEQADQGVPVEEMLPVKPPKSCNYICLGLSIVVSILAAGVSYYLVTP